MSLEVGTWLDKVQGVSMVSDCLPGSSEKGKTLFSNVLLPPPSASALLSSLSAMVSLREAGQSLSPPPLESWGSSRPGALPVPVLNPPPVNLRAVEQVVLLIAL